MHSLKRVVHGTFPWVTSTDYAWTALCTSRRYSISCCPSIAYLWVYDLLRRRSLEIDPPSALVGAGSVIRFARAQAATGEAWIPSLQERRPLKVVIIALANKTAWVACALMVRREAFSCPWHWLRANSSA